MEAIGLHSEVQFTDKDIVIILLICISVQPLNLTISLRIKFIEI